MRNFNKLFVSLSVGGLGLFSTLANAESGSVNCFSGHELAEAVTTAAPGSTLEVTGTCFGPINITVDDLILIGNASGDRAVIEKSGFIPFPQDVVSIDGARRVVLTGFDIKNGLAGVKGRGNASFKLEGVDVIDNIMGISLDSANLNVNNVNIKGTHPGATIMGLNAENGSTVTMAGTVDVSGATVFGINAQTNSSIIIEEDAILRSHDNLMGAQITVKSSLFSKEGAELHFINNETMGFSVNTGATAMLFHSDLFANNNGLDGVDVVSAASFEMDGDARLVSEFNGRQGISIDNSAFNMFGFFSTEERLPNVTSRNNGANGIQVENTSKFDVGRNASVDARDNGEAGVFLDDGSSAVIQQANINNNNGIPVRGPKKRAADIVASFGSRITFNLSNNVGFLSCDRTSMARGDVRCNRRH